MEWPRVLLAEDRELAKLPRYEIVQGGRQMQTVSRDCKVQDDLKKEKQTMKMVGLGVA